jgi:hypothetical protein
MTDGGLKKCKWAYYLEIRHKAGQKLYLVRLLWCASTSLSCMLGIPSFYCIFAGLGNLRKKPTSHPVLGECPIFTDMCNIPVFEARKVGTEVASSVGFNGCTHHPPPWVEPGPPKGEGVREKGGPMLSNLGWAYCTYR